MILSEAVDSSAETADAVRPVVEVVLDSAPSEALAPSASAAALMAAMARRSGAAPVELAAAPAPAEALEAAPNAAGTEAAPDAAEAPAEPDPNAPAPDADKPADPPKEEPAPVAAPVADPVIVATLSTERDTALREAALLRHRLDTRPTVDEDERAAYLADPVGAIRRYQARLLGVDEKAALLDEEAAFVQKELTIAAVGADNLDTSAKHQRSQEHTDRRWRFDQHLQAASRETAATREQEARYFAPISAAIAATAKEHPFLALAPVLDGLDPARAVNAIWNHALQTGETKPGATPADSMREALRLTDKFYRDRAQPFTKLGATDTAPVPANAPAQAPAPVGAPGAPKQPTSPAPAKAGSASPGTLSAKQAGTAPSVKATPTAPTRIVIDPTDKAGQRARIDAIAAKHRQP